jgi:hypothetical protein
LLFARGERHGTALQAAHARAQVQQVADQHDDGDAERRQQERRIVVKPQH